MMAALDFYSRSSFIIGGVCWRFCQALPRGTQGKWDYVRAFQTKEVVVKTSAAPGKYGRRPDDVDTCIFPHREKAIRVYAPHRNN